MKTKTNQSLKPTNRVPVISAIWLLILAWAGATAAWAGPAWATSPGRVVEWDFYDGVPIVHTNLPEGLDNVIAVAAGGVNYNYGFSVALRSDGTVIAWGDNSLGQTNVPPGLNSVVAIVAGATHALALKSDGTVVDWGEIIASIPAGLSNVVAIAGKHNHNLALKQDGTVVAWGQNNTGQANVPPGLSNVMAIAAGDIQSVALLSNRTMVAWGQAPLPEGLSNVLSIASGGYSDWLCRNLVLQSNGSVIAWGVWDTFVPAGLTNVVSIEVGETHYLAIRSDGSLFAWGQGYTGSTNIPAGLSNVVAVSGASIHNVAIVADLKITSLELTNQNAIIGFHTFVGQQYSVEFSPDLSPGSWNDVPGGAVTGNGSVQTVTDTNAVSQAPRFYRLRQ